MSTSLLRGTLVEYRTDVLRPLPNVVVFQFNPENISRTLNVATRRTTTAAATARQKEPAQTSAPPVETFDLTIHFSAADDLGKGGAAAAVPMAHGVAPQLAALEQMAYPKGGFVSGTDKAVVDAAGKALEDGGKATRKVPREKVPRILFIWGPSRVLPVEIRTLSITEQKFDVTLNPVQAEVRLGLAVASFPPGKSSGDKIGRGALQYTQKVKDGQSLLNLASAAAEAAVDVIPF